MNARIDARQCAGAGNRGGTQMQTVKALIITSAATAVLALGVATASAQTSPQGMQRNPQGNGAASLTPEQRSAIRTIIKDKLADEMRGGGGERLANAAAAVKTLTPEQQAAVRSAIKNRVAAQLREGLADRVADQVGDVGSGGPATLTPAQRAAIRSAISERVANDMRGNVGERLADAAAALKTLTPEQQAAVRTIIRNKVAAQVRAGLANRIADQLGD
jgi:hypothetical protein